MNQKIGIFAGTFDPLHEGHIAFATAALQTTDLDQVIFMPESSPRRKLNVTPIEQRISHIQSEVKNLPGLEVIHIDQPQYTIEKTMPVLAKLYPKSDFSILVGSDLVDHIHYWPHFETIRKNYQLIVGLRDGFDKSDVANYLQALGVKHTIIKASHSGVSSTQKKLS